MFITFEGIDFCGKSTQVELLKDHLLKKNKKVLVIREPGGTEISEKIRSVLLDKKNNNMSGETEIFLFSASRAQLVREKIRPSLEQGFYVISDRFHDSTTAYQGFGRGLSLSSVEHINNLAIGVTIPDITFIIDIPVKVAFERKKSRSIDKIDRLDNSTEIFFEKVKEGYLTLAGKDKRFRIIDGTKSAGKIHEEVVNEIRIQEQEKV